MFATSSSPNLVTDAENRLVDNNYELTEAQMNVVDLVVREMFGSTASSTFELYVSNTTLTEAEQDKLKQGVRGFLREFKVWNANSI